MAGHVATLGGVPLELDQEIGWSFTPGVNPDERHFALHRSRAADLMSRAGQPLTLVIPSTHGGRPLTARRVYVIEEAPGPHPDRVLVRVVDQRYWLRNVAVSRAFNVRRNTGETFSAGRHVLVANLLPREAYATYSLNGEQKHTAESMLRSVFDYVTQRIGTDYYLAGVPSDSLPIEDLEIAGSGDVAIQQALDYVPGWTFCPTPGGQLKVYDSRSGGERGVLEGRTIHFPGPGGSADWPIVANRAGARPAQVRVRFVRRLELGCSFAQGTQERASSPFRDRSVVLRNVAPSPDPLLRDVRDSSGRLFTVARGSFVEIGDADTYGLLRAWRDDQANNPWLTEDQGGVGPLTQQVICEHRAQGLGYIWEDFVNALVTPNPIWQARFDTINQHWRLTMQIHPEVWGRVGELEGQLLAIQDRATGARAPSPVFMDYLARPSRLGEMRGADGVRGLLRHGAHLQAFSFRDDNPIPVTPWRVVVLEPDAGVFTLVAQADPTGEADLFVPGSPVNEALPTPNPVEFTQNPEVALFAWDYVELRRTWEFSTIVSVTQMAPNDERRLHEEIVTPSEAGAVLGRDVGPCLAPEAEILVMPSLMHARFRWDDLLSYLYVEGALFSGDPIPRRYLIHEDHVRAVAVAAAAALYDGLLDRPETSGAEVPLDPLAEPSGAVGSVRHSLTASGGARTILSVPKLGPIDRNAVFRWLPPATRKFVLRTL